MSEEEPTVPDLFAPASVASDLRGHGPSLIQWRYYRRVESPFPFADLIADYDPALATARSVDVGDEEIGRLVDQRTAEDLVCTYLTRDEAYQLAAYLRDHHPAWFDRFYAYRIDLPIAAAQADAETLYDPDPDEEDEWIIRLGIGPMIVEGVGARPALPVVGHVEPWPHGDLDPHDLGGLLDLNDRLGSRERGQSREGRAT